jgi:hypothetical protein
MAGIKAHSRRSLQPASERNSTTHLIRESIVAIVFQVSHQIKKDTLAGVLLD